VAAVIQAEGLSRMYGTRRGIVDLDIDVREGEIFGFLGPNGAGKTTTIRLLLGFLRPTGGRSSVFGLDAWAAAAEVHRRVAYLGSDPAYLGELDAGDQLDYLAALRGLPTGAWRAAAERFDLDPTVQVKKLSRGNRQKVGVVATLMGNEPLLILDEPTTGLDPLMQHEFLTALGEARAAGRTVFLSSHNLPEVERTCDRVAIIREGRLVEISTIEAMLATHSRRVSLTLESAAPPGAFDLPGVETVSGATDRQVLLMVRGDINPLLRRLATLEVRDVTIATPEIEEVFLRFYGAEADAARQADVAEPAGPPEAAS
jgi:ABC-2 type transport system ATP-binding protein